MALAQEKVELEKIKKHMQVVEQLLIGVTGSLIATGICGLIAQLPIW